MAYKGRFFALYADGTSALAASERELSELRGDRVETVSGHAEALDADAELMALFAPVARVDALAEDLDRAAIGKIAEQVRGTPAERATLTAIRAQIDERLAEIEAGGGDAVPR